MTLESVYYLTGIIFYLAWIILLIALIFIAWKTFKVIERAPEEIKQKLSELLPTGKKEIWSIVGMVATTFIVNKLKNMFKRD
jgi:hypothetical protein